MLVLLKKIFLFPEKISFESRQMKIFARNNILILIISISVFSITLLIDEILYRVMFFIFFCFIAYILTIINFRKSFFKIDHNKLTKSNTENYIIYNNNKIKYIIIIKIDQIGDFLLSCRSLLKLKNKFKDCKIDIIINKENYEIAKNLDIFTNIILFDSIINDNFFENTQSYDLSIDMRLYGDTFEILDKLKSTYKICFNTANSRDSSYIKVDLPQNGYRHVQFIMDLIADVAINEFSIPDPIKIDYGSQSSKLDSEPAPYVVFSLAAGNEVKRFSEAKLVKLGQELSKLGKQVVLLGGPNETNIAASLMLEIGELNISNQVGKHSLLEAFEIIEKSHIYIGFDTGLTHFAALNGVSTVAIYHQANDLGMWRPRGQNVSLIMAEPMNCGQCALSSVSNCEFDHSCMEKIKIDEIVDCLKAIEVRKKENDKVISIPAGSA